MRLKKIAAPMLLCVLFGALLVQLPMAIAAKASDYDWIDPLVTIRAMLLEYFVEDVDESKLKDMQDSMIDSMIASLDDPYSVYVPPDDKADFDKRLRGLYVGIGSEIDIVDGFLTIVTPMDDSPSLEQGILAGDTVLEIDGKSTFGISIDDCIDTLTGSPGTSVKLLVRHTTGEEENINIVRRQIIARTVKGMNRVGEKWNFRIDPKLGLGYFRITQFNSTTIKDVRSALNELQKDGLNGLIVDLRFNPGGNLDGAVEIADMFLQNGTIVSVKGRRDNDVYKARSAGTLPYFPMVVISNETSASASEILAGALQDNDRAKVLGERSYGKGSVQQVRTLPDKLGTLKLTTAYYYMPDGRNIHRKPDSTIWGVDPDEGFYVSMNDEEYNNLIISRRKYEIIHNGDNGDRPDWSRPGWIEEKIGDIQLARALEALQKRVGGEEWPEVGETGGSDIALGNELVAAIDYRTRVATQLERADERIRELNDQATDAGRETLLPIDVDLADGTVTVTDKHGNVVGVYRITNGHLEQALEYARLEKIEE